MSAAAGTQLPRASHALPGPYRSRTLCSKKPQLGFQLGSGPMFYVKMFGRLSSLRSQSSRPIQHAFSVGCYHRRVRQSREKIRVSREKLDRSRETICTSWKPSETREFSNVPCKISTFRRCADRQPRQPSQNRAGQIREPLETLVDCG